VEEKSFVYVPRAANLLREREQHIALLEGELEQNKSWLQEAQRDHQQLLELHAGQKAQLEEHNRWGLQLEKDWKAALERIAAVQGELKIEQDAARRVVAQYEAKIQDLEAENHAKTQWALETEQRLSAELAEKTTELAAAVDALHSTEQTLDERTHWAQSLQEDIDRLSAILSFVRSSRWVKLGRTLGVGPKVDGE
jgi:chromosome segregation ATPase